ncbi:MAG: DUF4258 domain-containing protein [Cyanobacteriota bacterium]|jgi:hypothetical protein
MKTLEEIKSQLRAGKFEFTRHAFNRAIQRNISEAEIREAGLTMELIEDYLDDKFSPSCLLLGFTLANRALHLQVSRLESDDVKIVTIYEPDLNRWIDYRRRKPNV